MGFDPVNSFSSDDVSWIQENEESEEEALKWSRGNRSNSSAFAWQCWDAMMTLPQHDSDDESSDDDLADWHEDNAEGKEKDEEEEEFAAPSPVEDEVST